MKTLTKLLFVSALFLSSITMAQTKDVIIQDSQSSETSYENPASEAVPFTNESEEDIALQRQLEANAKQSREAKANREAITEAVRQRLSKINDKENNTKKELEDERMRKAAILKRKAMKTSQKELAEKQAKQN